MIDTDTDRPRPRPEEPDLPAQTDVEAALEGLVRAVLPCDARRPRTPIEAQEPRASYVAGKFPTSLKIAAKRAD